MNKSKLTSLVAGIILRHVRNPKGRLTELSDMCQINRAEFNVKGLSKMKLYRLLRIIYGLTLFMTYEEFTAMMNELSETILDFSDEFEYGFFDE